MSDSLPTRCVACGNSEIKTLTTLATGRQMVRCDTCHLVFVVPIWSGDIARNVFADYHGWPEGITGGSPNRDPGLEFIAGFLAKNPTTGGQLLDIGCAKGDFFDVMRKRGGQWKLYGVEPDPKWKDHDYNGAIVSNKPLGESEFDSGQFDVVTVLDALYYFPDPEQQFMEIGRIVKAGGMFVFDVPGQAYLRLRGLLGAIAGMRRTRTFAAYPFYYSDQALRLFLDRAGFVIEKRLVDRGARHQSMLRNGMLFYTEMIKYLSSVLPRLFSFSPKVVYVARRK